MAVIVWGIHTISRRIRRRCRGCCLGRASRAGRRGGLLKAVFHIGFGLDFGETVAAAHDPVIILVFVVVVSLVVGCVGLVSAMLVPYGRKEGIVVNQGANGVVD